MTVGGVSAVCRNSTSVCSLKSITCDDEDVGAVNSMNRGAINPSNNRVCVVDDTSEVVARRGQRGRCGGAGSHACIAIADLY